jgi:ABC-type antimicrobial peptide transport system permease subunit
MLEGRDFNEANVGHNHVAIVNQVLAAREWPGETALGHRLHAGEIRVADGLSWATVVGVVGNVHSYDLTSTPGPDLYIPRAENPSGNTTFLVNASADPALFKNVARQKLKTQFPGAAFFSFQTISEEMLQEVSERAFLTEVLIAFGAIALFLSILGTYGLLAYEVSLRVKEIGIRLALGCSRQKIVRLLVCEHGRWLLSGTFLGLACAITTGYAFRSRFYGLQSTSVDVLIASAVLLLLPALLAIALPARHASLQDPADTLRRE